MLCGTGTSDKPSKVIKAPPSIPSRISRDEMFFVSLIRRCSYRHPMPQLPEPSRTSQPQALCSYGTSTSRKAEGNAANVESGTRFPRASGVVVTYAWPLNKQNREEPKSVSVSSWRSRPHRLAGSASTTRLILSASPHGQLPWRSCSAACNQPKSPGTSKGPFYGNLQ